MTAEKKKKEIERLARIINASFHFFRILKG